MIQDVGHEQTVPKATVPSPWVQHQHLQPRSKCPRKTAKPLDLFINTRLVLKTKKLSDWQALGLNSGEHA